MDFVADHLVDGRSVRALTVVDVFSGEALAIEVGIRLRAEHVVAALTAWLHSVVYPSGVHGQHSEFTGRLLDWDLSIRFGWASVGQKPIGNRFVETFNGSLRDECLSQFNAPPP